MRPALAALREQQTVIAGIQTTAAQREAQHRDAFGKLRSLALRQQARLNAQDKVLRAIAAAVGIAPEQIDALVRTADVQNPAQPVPEPNAVPATQSTPEVNEPEAFADVNAPGLVPGSTQDVAADAVSTAYTPGQDIEGPALKNLIDVTAPVDGTQTPQPLSDVRTETDVRVGNPMNPSTAFPLGGEFANAQRLSKRQDKGARTVASLRLAEARIGAGVESGDKYEVAGVIEKDASLSTESIEREIATLGKVAKVATKEQPRNLVPRAANVKRTVPSLAATAAAAGSTADTDDSDLFF
jgi:hypothetical protein